MLGDSIGAGLVYHLSKKELEEVSNKKMEGGFEALPMTEIEDNDERNKWMIWRKKIWQQKKHFFVWSCEHVI